VVGNAIIVELKKLCQAANRIRKSRQDQMSTSDLIVKKDLPYEARVENSTVDCDMLT
jgi:hypothetical protein